MGGDRLVPERGTRVCLLVSVGGFLGRSGVECGCGFEDRRKFDQGGLAYKGFRSWCVASERRLIGDIKLDRGHGDARLRGDAVSDGVYLGSRGVRFPAGERLRRWEVGRRLSLLNWHRLGLGDAGGFEDWRTLAKVAASRRIEANGGRGLAGLVLGRCRVGRGGQVFGGVFRRSSFSKRMGRLRVVRLECGRQGGCESGRRSLFGGGVQGDGSWCGLMGRLLRRETLIAEGSCGGRGSLRAGAIAVGAVWAVVAVWAVWASSAVIPPAP